MLSSGALGRALHIKLPGGMYQLPLPLFAQQGKLLCLVSILPLFEFKRIASLNQMDGLAGYQEQGSKIL